MTAGKSSFTVNVRPTPLRMSMLPSLRGCGINAYQRFYFPSHSGHHRKAPRARKTGGKHGLVPKIQ